MNAANNRIAELEKICNEKSASPVGFHPASSLLPRTESSPSFKVVDLQAQNETLRGLLESSEKEVTELRSQLASPVLSENLKRKGSELSTPLKQPKVQLPRGK